MKTWIYVERAVAAPPLRLCWFPGTSDEALERSLRAQLRLVDGVRLLLRDADGDLVPVSSALPHDQRFTLVEVTNPVACTCGSSGVAASRTGEAATSSAEDTSSSVATTTSNSEEIDGISTEVEAPNFDAINSSSNVEAYTSSSEAVVARTSMEVIDSNNERVTVADAIISSDGSGQAANAEVDVENGELESGQAQRRVTKRPRIDAGDEIVLVPSPSPSKSRAPSQVVKLFLEVFTRPIADNDNVSFIPSTGRFALYELFCTLVTDRSLHPKSQDAFYKITSVQGKVDRQRVIRYYRAPVSSSDDVVEVVQYKPHGKGPLLRRYLRVDSASALAQAAQSAEPLVAILGRDPDETVARYMDFVRGFVPVSKVEYTSHQSRYEAVARRL